MSFFEEYNKYLKTGEEHYLQAAVRCCNIEYGKAIELAVASYHDVMSTIKNDTVYSLSMRLNIPFEVVDEVFHNYLAEILS